MPDDLHLWELGLDAAASPDAVSDEQLFIGRAELFFCPFRRYRVKKMYVHVGGGGAGEVDGDHTYTDGFASVGTGTGIDLGRSQLDLRLSYLRFMESANSQRALLFTLGYGF